MTQHDSVEWAEQNRRSNVRTKILLLLLKQPTDGDTIAQATEADFVLSPTEIGWRLGKILKELLGEESIIEDNGKFQLTESMRAKIEHLRTTLPSQLE